ESEGVLLEESLRTVVEIGPQEDVHDLRHRVHDAHRGHGLRIPVPAASGWTWHSRDGDRDARYGTRSPCGLEAKGRRSSAPSHPRDGASLQTPWPARWPASCYPGPSGSRARGKPRAERAAVRRHVRQTEGRILAISEVQPS